MCAAVFNSPHFHFLFGAKPVNTFGEIYMRQDNNTVQWRIQNLSGGTNLLSDQFFSWKMYENENFVPEW